MRTPEPSSLLLALCLLASCSPEGTRGAAPQGAAATVTGDTVALVNGVAIHQVDLLLRLRERSHQGELKPEFRRNLLDGIIREEVIARRAVELGLDADPIYQARLRELEAQVDAYRRSALSELFFKKEVAEKVVVSDAEAQKYFDDHADRIRAELHVFQILRRDQASIDALHQSIAQGASFEQVAQGLFPSLPAGGQAPWDLGYLTWKQIPEAWGDVVYGLEKGGVSGVIRGPNDRFWIIKLIDRRENPRITFETAKPTVVGILKESKIAALRREVEQSLQSKARVVISESQMAPPKDPTAPQ